MPLWSVILILSGGLISFAVIADIISKKKNRRFNPEALELKNEAEADIHSQANLSQTTNQFIQK
ncbi:MAG TPA: hypothetical protein VNM69_21075 [Bacillus sp. (in: firmicutes)]|uniref:hypothetical protein n=1 Tax=Bacillus litorisediminis TaxID=2922713 RepID=UPI001FAC91FD|nr:hypothetical protein [Bacillus litorisediminis]HWO78366.1 hypothetical protein [Bacillus sp. (in: firmicutes)]